MAAIHNTLQQLKDLADRLEINITEITLTQAQWEAYTSDDAKVQKLLEVKKIPKEGKGMTIISVYQ